MNPVSREKHVEEGERLPVKLEGSSSSLSLYLKLKFRAVVLPSLFRSLKLMMNVTRKVLPSCGLLSFLLYFLEETEVFPSRGVPTRERERQGETRKVENVENKREKNTKHGFRSVSSPSSIQVEEGKG